MDKYLIIIRSFVFVICFFPLLWGCGKQSEPPPKPKVITKKIIIGKKDASQPQKPKKIVVLKSASKKEAAKPKPVKTAEPLPKPKVITKKIIIAKKDESQPQKPKKIDVSKSALKKEVVKPKPVAAKKEPVKPKPEAAQDVSKAKADVPTKKSVASVTATTQITPDTTDFYNPEGKLDPFASLYKEKPVAVAGEKSPKKPRRPLTPLEKVDLSQLKLVAIIRAASGNRALVEEASGKGYVIKKGTYIGTRSGKVDKILPDRIIVEEEVKDFDGKVSVREIEVKLKPSGEE